MESIFLAASLVLALLAIIQSLLLAVQTFEHRRYGRSCMTRLNRHHPSGHAAVFMPCKGLDVGLRENLRAVLRQDYRDYEVMFIVESYDDPACDTIRLVMAEHPWVPSQLVVAGPATKTGQKVHNLRVATADLSPWVKYLAFLDSDAGPRPQWLRVLVARLGKPGYGAVTGYRWFVPKRHTFTNSLLYSFNCGVMSLLGRSSHYLIWGGSWGIRRKVFESIGLHEAWQGTLSDDLIASRELRRAGLPVRFEPACVVASPMNYSPREMLSFVRRQYLVGRFYTPGWWAFALAAATLTNLVWMGIIFLLAASLRWGTPPLWIPLGTLAVLYLLSVYRGRVRQDLIDTYFPEKASTLAAATRFDTWANPAAGLVHWLGMVGSLLGNSIGWRGIKYRMLSGGKIERIERQDDSSDHTARSDQYEQSEEIAAKKQTWYRKAG